MPSLILQKWLGIDQSEGVKRNSADRLFSCPNGFPTVEKILKRRLGTQIINQFTSNTLFLDTASTNQDEFAGLTYDAFSWKDPRVGWSTVRTRIVANGSLRWSNPKSVLEWFIPQASVPRPPGIPLTWFDEGFWFTPTYLTLDKNTYAADNQGHIRGADYSVQNIANADTAEGYYGLKTLGALNPMGGLEHAAYVLNNDKLLIFPGPGGDAPWLWLKVLPSTINMPPSNVPVTFAVFHPSVYDWAPDVGQLPHVLTGQIGTHGATGYTTLLADPDTNSPAVGSDQSCYGTPNALGIQAATLRPTTATLYAHGQLCIGGFSGIMSNSIVFCETEPGRQMPTLSDDMLLAAHYTVGPEGSTDPVVALITQPLIGGADVLRTLMLILKRNTCWVGTGLPVINPSGVNPTFQTQLVHNTAGCVSQRTVTKTPHGTIWMSDDNVWLWIGGPQPIAIGKHISPILRKCATNLKECHAIYTPLNIEDQSAGGIYRLCLPVSDTYIPDLSNLYLPTERQCNIQLWLDMRPGFDPQNPMWWGPMELPSSALYVNLDKRIDRSLLRGFYSYGKIATGGQSDVSQSDLPSDIKTRHIKYDVTIPNGGDDHTIIPGLINQPKSHLRLLTHEFDFQKPELRKLIPGMDIVFNPGTGIVSEYVAEARWIGDGGALFTTPAFRIRNPMGAPFPALPAGQNRIVNQTGFFLGGSMGTLGTTGTRREFQSIRLFPATGRGPVTTTRFECKAFQLNLFPIPQPDIEGGSLSQLYSYIQVTDSATGLTWYIYVTNSHMTASQTNPGQVGTIPGIILAAGDVILDNNSGLTFAISVTNGSITTTQVASSLTAPVVLLQDQITPSVWAISAPQGQLTWSDSQLSLVWEQEADQPDLEIFSIGVNMNPIRRPPT